MTARERFHLTMDYGKPDRVPYFEEGLRDDVIKAWRKQGLASDLSLLSEFPADRFEQLLPEIGPIPDFRKWPTDANGLAELVKRLDENPGQRLPENWRVECAGWQHDESVVFLRIQRGFFQTLGVYKWNRFNELMSLLVENSGFVEKFMEIHTEFLIRLAQIILSKVRIDAVIFSEPIGGTEGPLISPEMYERFALNYYQRIIRRFRAAGIKHIIFRTYANTRILIPQILDYGFNCLWACETNAEAMDYVSIRKEFGRDLRLIGGIDLDTLRHNRTTIQDEIDKVVPGLIADGGYIPLADGRVRPDVPLENYLFYRKYLQKTIEKLM